MRRRNALLLLVAFVLLETHLVQASVIIKAVPHANVKMEFGAHHVPPHDVALLDESAKVDGTTRLGIEVPHSHNHRNVLIHKIGTYLTVVMKALAKTVAPAQDQDGKTHFDIHVDADLGDNDKDKKDEPPQFTIVQSKLGEGGEQIKGDCVKAVVVVSESEGDDKKEEHKSSEISVKDENKNKGSHIVFHYNSEDSKESKDHHKANIHQVLDPKNELKKKDSHIVFRYNSEDSKESKDQHKQKIHQAIENKIQVAMQKKEEKKEDLSERLKFKSPKDWESFKKTQEMLKQKGFILQLDKSFMFTKENQQKSSQKAQILDVKDKINLSLEGKSLSEEEMEESERNWKALELTEPDPEEMWISMINPTEANSRYQSHSSKNEVYSEITHPSSVNDLSKESKQIQTVKATYQSVPLINTKPFADISPSSNKAMSYEMVKQTSKSEKVIPTKAELSFAANEIPSQISSHFEQTSYSSDRSRAMTIVSKEQPTVETSKEVLSEPAVLQVKDKLTENSVPHLKTHDDSSHEVIMRLAQVSKSGPAKKAQIIDVKKVKNIKPSLSDEEELHDPATRQENIRKLPMANIPTLIDVLQKAPPQEFQRLTQIADAGTSQEYQNDNFAVVSTNITDPSTSKSPREFQLPELHVNEEQKDLTHRVEDLRSPAPDIDKETSTIVTNEKLHIHPEETHTSKEEGVTEGLSVKSTCEHPYCLFKDLGVLKKSNLEDHPSLNLVSENPSTLKSMEMSISTESDTPDIVIDALNSGDGPTLEKNLKNNIDHKGESNQKALVDNTNNIEVEDKARNTSLTVVIADIGDDARASHALSSLTAWAEEARALDISPHQVENHPTEVPVSAVSPKSLNQDFESLLSELEVLELAGLGKHETPSSISDHTELKGEILNHELPSITLAYNEPKDATSSDTQSVLSAHDESSIGLSADTPPSLPEHESMSVPTPKERELLLEDEPNILVSNLVNEALPEVEVDRDGRVYHTQPDTSSLITPLETSVTTPIIPLNNAVPDPNSPYIYSYYPAFHPEEVYPSQNSTEDAEGLYGTPSPRVICVNTDTGKVLDDSSKDGDQGNAVAPELGNNNNNKEDDKLMLLKLLHDDIQKLKMQLKIQ